MYNKQSVDSALDNYKKMYTYITGNETRWVSIGYTTANTNNQSFTTLDIKIGRADGWYTTANLAISLDGRTGSIYGITNTNFNSCDIYVYKIDNKLYVYAYMTSYCRLEVAVGKSSNFQIEMQSKVQPNDSLLHWHDWKRIASMSDLANYVLKSSIENLTGKKLYILGNCYYDNTLSFGITYRIGGSSIGTFVDDTYYLAIRYDGLLAVGIQINNEKNPRWFVK